MSGTPPLHPQLEALRVAFIAAQVRLHRLADTVPHAKWARRPSPERWSIAECVGHLNLTGAAFLPLLEAALREGRQLGIATRKRYRRDPVGWLLWRMAGPPVRYRTSTTTAFVPASDMPVPKSMDEFDRLQKAQIDCVNQADGLDLGRMWIRSPFDPRVRYNAYACLSILPRHQHRHLWQAEAAWKAISSQNS